MTVRVKDIRLAIANLPDDAQVVLWVATDESDEMAVDVGRVTSYGPNGLECPTLPDSFHIYEVKETFLDRVRKSASKLSDEEKQNLLDALRK